MRKVNDAVFDRRLLDYTASYQAIADAIDNPKAVRAVGTANDRNPVAIIVPYHRITGYGTDLWRKEWLLMVWGWDMISTKPKFEVQHREI